MGKKERKIKKGRERKGEKGGERERECREMKRGRRGGRERKKLLLSFGKVLTKSGD